MLDLLTVGETMAVMAPVESGPLRYRSDFKLKIAGAESNVAIGLSKLGYTTGWFSRLGDDELGHYVNNMIRAEGVNTEAVIFDDKYHTGLMIKENANSRETKVHYYRENSAASHMTCGDIDAGYVKSAKILHLTGITPVLSSSSMDFITELVDMAGKSDVLLSFDPNIRYKLWKKQDYSEYLRWVTLKSNIVMMGIDEGKQLFGTDDVDELLAIVKEKGEADYIALKDGENGAYVSDRYSCIHIPPYPCRPIDPIGAGDGFNAGFLAGILSGKNLETAGRMGTVSGALATETTGDSEGYPTGRQMRIILENGVETYR